MFPGDELPASSHPRSGCTAAPASPAPTTSLQQQQQRLDTAPSSIPEGGIPAISLPAALWVGPDNNTFNGNGNGSCSNPSVPVTAPLACSATVDNQLLPTSHMKGSSMKINLFHKVVICPMHGCVQAHTAASHLERCTNMGSLESQELQSIIFQHGIKDFPANIPCHVEGLKLIKHGVRCTFPGCSKVLPKHTETYLKHFANDHKGLDSVEYPFEELDYVQQLSKVVRRTQYFEAKQPPASAQPRISGALDDMGAIESFVDDYQAQVEALEAELVASHEDKNVDAWMLKSGLASFIQQLADKGFSGIYLYKLTDHAQSGDKELLRSFEKAMELYFESLATLTRKDGNYHVRQYFVDKKWVIYCDVMPACTDIGILGAASSGSSNFRNISDHTKQWPGGFQCSSHAFYEFDWRRKAISKSCSLCHRSARISWRNPPNAS